VNKWAYEESFMSERSSKAKTAFWCGLGGVLALAVNQKLQFFDMGVSADRQTQVTAGEAKITKITPIDLGCFVNVESEVPLQADVHNRVSGFGVTKTISTDTTKATYQGDADLCVDNKDTQVFIREDLTGERVLHVVIGSLVVNRPRVNHDGQDIADYDPSLGTRLAGALGGSDNRNVVAGLDATAQFLIGDTACANEAVEVAQSQINSHYSDLAKQIGNITAVEVSYQSVLPTSKTPPSGNLKEALSQAGYIVPEDWDISAGAMTCAAIIDGKPAVNVRPKPQGSE
jgi:hypothetical protein